MSCITHVLYVYCVELSKCEELIKFYLSVCLISFVSFVMLSQVVVLFALWPPIKILNIYFKDILRKKNSFLLIYFLVKNIWLCTKRTTVLYIRRPLLKASPISPKWKQGHSCGYVRQFYSYETHASAQHNAEASNT